MLPAQRAMTAPASHNAPAGKDRRLEPPRVRWRLRCFGLRHDYSVFFAGQPCILVFSWRYVPAGGVEPVLVVPGHPFSCRHGYLPGVLPRALVIDEFFLVK